MFTAGQARFQGEHFRVDGAFNNPKPIRGDIPILIGGSGERKTLRLVAQYGDGCNLFGDAEPVKHLLGVLDAATATDVGRDYVGDHQDGARTRADRADARGGRGQEGNAARARRSRRRRIDSMISGDPDTVGERVQALKDSGLEGFGFSMPDAYDLEALALAGQTLSKVFPRRRSREHCRRWCEICRPSGSSRRSPSSPSGSAPTSSRARSSGSAPSPARSRSAAPSPRRPTRAAPSTSTSGYFDPHVKHSRLKHADRDTPRLRAALDRRAHARAG